MTRIFFLFFVLAAFSLNAQTPNALGGATQSKGVSTYTVSSSAQVDSLKITLLDGSVVKVARTMKILLGTAAPVGTAIADMFIDTVGTDTQYINNAGTWVRFSVGTTATTTLDDAYNNFGATASKITVDAAQSQTGGLEIEATGTQNVTIDIQGTGRFIIQDAGVTDLVNVDGNGGEIRLLNNTDNGTQQFQINGTGYIASVFDFGGNWRDNRSNSFWQQSASSLASNRISTFGGTSYLEGRNTFKTYKFDPTGNYTSWSGNYGWTYDAGTSTSGNSSAFIFMRSASAAASSSSPGGDILFELGAGDGAGRQGRVGIGLGNTAANSGVSAPTAMLDVNGTANFRNSVGVGTTSPDKIFGIGDGTDEFSMSVLTDKLTWWNDAGTSIAKMVFDSTGALSVNNSTITPSAVLEATSTTRGFLQPRMTTTQRNAISSPATGLQVYNTSLNKMNFYNGSSWLALVDSATLVASGTGWVLGGQNIAAESSIGSNDAFGVNIETNNTNRLRISSAGRFFTGTLTDINLVASDSVKFTGATMDLASTAELKVTSSAQTSLRSIGGLHSYISATSPNAGGNAGHLWENSADANDGYNMRREADGKFIFARATDYPYSTETDTIFNYNQSTNTFDFDVTNLTQNGVALLNGTTGDATYWKLGGQNTGANANVGPTDAFRFGITTNGTARLYFGSTGRMFSNTLTDVILEPSDSAKISATTIDLAGSVKVTGSQVVTGSVQAVGVTLNAGRLQGAKGADVASANDMTLGSDGNFFHITGTTQINGIASSGWQDGSVIILIFDGLSLTVNDAGSPGGGFLPLALNGAVDFSATQNDVLQFVKDSSAWREISRTVN